MGAFTMPSLGADMDAGTVTHWLAHPGDEVHRGDVVAVVETDKSAIEVEVFEDGVMGEPLVAEGTRVPVGTVLADIAPPRAPAPAVAPAGGLVAGQAVGAPSPEPAGGGPAPGAPSPGRRGPGQRPGAAR